jgi:hypothetical protein
MRWVTLGMIMQIFETTRQFFHGHDGRGLGASHQTGW